MNNYLRPNSLNHHSTVCLSSHSFGDGRNVESRFLIILDHSFRCLIDLMGLKVVEGSSFNREKGSDYRDAFLANETLVKKMGWKDAIGKRIIWSPKQGKGIGVLKFKG